MSASYCITNLFPLNSYHLNFNISPHYTGNQLGKVLVMHFCPIANGSSFMLSGKCYLMTSS